MIDVTLYTLDDGLTYHIDFYRTKDHINLEHYKTVKYLKLSELKKLRDNIDKIVTKFRNPND